MRKMEVFLKSREDAIAFVSLLSNLPCEADLSYGSYTVDAKSILGVIGVGIGKKSTLTLYSDENQGIEEELNQYKLCS